MTKPFMRWAGGKSQIAAHILGVMPAVIPVFRDPTFGGGAIFYALAGQGRIGRAHLSDLNWRLVAACRAVRDDLDRVTVMLGSARDTPAEYARAVAALNTVARGDGDLVAGALAIQINRTCFNGLWRENRSGKINSPYGGGVRGAGGPVLDSKYEQRLAGAREAFLKTSATIDVADFEPAIGEAAQGDLVFVDPPYLRRSKTSFTAYVGDSAFGEAAHERLARCLRAAGDRGVKFVLASADTAQAREIYQSVLGQVSVKVLQVRRAINSDGRGRGAVQEMLVWNYSL